MTGNERKPTATAADEDDVAVGEEEMKIGERKKEKGVSIRRESGSGVVSRFPFALLFFCVLA